MKRTLSLVLALIMLLSVTAAFADGKQIDGLAERKIKINEAGLNEVDDLVSPTTGRNLMEIEVPGGFLGLAAPGEYQPILVQVSNAVTVWGALPRSRIIAMPRSTASMLTWYMKLSKRRAAASPV